MGTIKGLGYQNLVDYVLENSNLTKDQFEQLIVAP